MQPIFGMGRLKLTQGEWNQRTAVRTFLAGFGFRVQFARNARLLEGNNFIVEDKCSHMHSPSMRLASLLRTVTQRPTERHTMKLILLILLILLLLGAAPVWPHSINWGYYPSGGLGLVLL